jgi:hypothetical protein
MALLEPIWFYVVGVLTVWAVVSLSNSIVYDFHGKSFQDQELFKAGLSEAIE